MWATILTVGLQVLGWILKKNEMNVEMQKQFYDFIEAQHDTYLNSATMRQKAQDRFIAIANKPFQESP